VEIVGYQPEHARAFKRLNLAWITAHWQPEPADFKALDYPQENIIDRGGYIAIALEGSEVQGVCALVKMHDHCYELAKMAVAEAARGQGIGWSLGVAVVDKARALSASRVYLESNTVLEPALNLYRKLGFVRVAKRPSPYERANVHMELLL
jgi:GNAT superfamily N-acetyltransferase